MHRLETSPKVVIAAALVLGLAGCGGDTGDAGDATAAAGAGDATETAHTGDATQTPGGGDATQAGRAGEETGTAQLEAEIAALEQRAERLRDISAIERLQRAYAYYVDRADWDAVVDLMTDDATAEHGGHGVYVGKDSIRDLLYALGGGEAGLEPGELNDHIHMQPVIDVAADGETAEGRWRQLALLGRYEEYARWQAGAYENEYRKEDGRWKISRIRWAEAFTVPFDEGLTAHVEADAEPELDLPPPDRPPTFEHARWPEVSLLPFHFEHPVASRDAPQGEPQ